MVRRECLGHHVRGVHRRVAGGRAVAVIGGLAAILPAGFAPNGWVSTQKKFFSVTPPTASSLGAGHAACRRCVGRALSAALSSGVQPASTVASGAAMGASAGASANANGAIDNTTSYFVDLLFRPRPQQACGCQSAKRRRSGRAGLAHPGRHAAAGEEVSADDNDYLTKLVAARTGLSEADAKARVDGMVAQGKGRKGQGPAGRRHS